MSTNKTTHYGLHLWEPEDTFVRAEFNENSTKVDTALQGLETSKAKQSDLTTLQTKVNGKVDTTTVSALESSLSAAIAQRGYTAAGHYTGNGNASRLIDVGFPLKGVLVERCDGNRSISNGIWGGIAVVGSGAGALGSPVAVVSGNGFTVYHRGANTLNSKDMTYHYLALG